MPSWTYSLPYKVRLERAIKVHRARLAALRHHLQAQRRGESHARDLLDRQQRPNRPLRPHRKTHSEQEETRRGERRPREERQTGRNDDESNPPE